MSNSRREEWDAKQAQKMRAAIKAQERLSELEDAQRHRDNQRGVPPGWTPEEPTAFGGGATEALRRAME